MDPFRDGLQPLLVSADGGKAVESREFLSAERGVDVITGHASPPCPLQTLLHLLHKCQVAQRNLSQASATGKTTALFPSSSATFPGECYALRLVLHEVMDLRLLQDCSCLSFGCEGA